VGNKYRYYMVFLYIK